jgi:hypothetical protein
MLHVIKHGWVEHVTSLFAQSLLFNLTRIKEDKFGGPNVREVTLNIVAWYMNWLV